MPRTKEQIAELSAKLARDYEAGSSISRLSRRYDIAESHVGRLLHRAGVQMRPPASFTPERRLGFGDLNREQVLIYRERLRTHKPGRR